MGFRADIRVILAGAGLAFAHLAGGEAVAAEISVAPAPGALAASIAAASPGDTLLLAPGRHDGPIVLEKSLTLQGNGDAAIVGDGEGSVVTVDAPDSAILNLVIEGSGRSGAGLDAGVRLTERARRTRVEGNILRNNFIGVDVHGAEDAIVSANEINGLAIARMNDRGNGVYVWNARGAVIENNRIIAGKDGVFLSSSRENVIRGNRMEKLRFAIHYMYTLDSRIIENVSVGNHLGFALMFSSGLEVRGNQSIGDRDRGILLNFVNGSTVAGNSVRGGAEKCLFMYNANKDRLEENRFEGCDIGVHFTAGSANEEITGNAFVNNRTQVKYVGSTIREWSRNGAGNYWSDNAAYDVNGDGVADAPYRPNDAIDKIVWTQPAARFLLGSPAVQIIRWAQSAFPALLPGGVVDSAPLMRAPRLNSSEE